MITQKSDMELRRKSRSTKYLEGNLYRTHLTQRLFVYDEKSDWYFSVSPGTAFILIDKNVRFKIYTGWRVFIIENILFMPNMDVYGNVVQI